MRSMDFDSLSRQSNKQTLTRAKICHGDHGAPLPSSHSRLLRKLRHTLTLMVSWKHSSLTWMQWQGRTQRRQKNKNTSESCKQWQLFEAKYCQKLLKTKHQVMGLDVPRLIRASSSSLIQFPSWKSAMSKLANHNTAKTLVWKGLGQVLWKKWKIISPWGCRCQSWKMRRGAPPSSWCPEWNRCQV